MEEKRHLVIIQNGFHGRSNRMISLKALLDEQFCAAHEIVISNVNDFMESRDGAFACGRRLSDFVCAFVKSGKYSFLSFIGHSFGGLMVRAAIGFLEEAGVFADIEAGICATVATPHLGLLQPPTWMRVISFLGVLGQTGKELSRQNCNIDALNSGVFLAGLKRFRFLVYANLERDWQVPFETAAMRLGKYSIRPVDAELMEIVPTEPHPIADLLPIAARRGVRIPTGTAHTMIMGRSRNLLPVGLVVPYDIIRELNVFGQSADNAGAQQVDPVVSEAEVAS
eukprot:TRINITY_DN9881_c0_g2_i1.p1 TRINITY_DN9881_c0_g2~~TRINITY_DN9881_c0_g2_i1.p1  ORF type:complete len:282 (-),score=41.66 TRINITY_DN9881_c0_g2_i1:156-1001(-)